jgi:hypothetical protein
MAASVVGAADASRLASLLRSSQMAQSREAACAARTGKRRRCLPRGGSIASSVSLYGASAVCAASIELRGVHSASTRVRSMMVGSRAARL